MILALFGCFVESGGYCGDTDPPAEPPEHTWTLSGVPADAWQEATVSTTGSEVVIEYVDADGVGWRVTYAVGE